MSNSTEYQIKYIIADYITNPCESVNKVNKYVAINFWKLWNESIVSYVVTQ